MLSNHFNTHNSNYMFQGQITGQIFCNLWLRAQKGFLW